MIDWPILTCTLVLVLVRMRPGTVLSLDRRQLRLLGVDGHHDQARLRVEPRLHRELHAEGNLLQRRLPERRRRS